MVLEVDFNTTFTFRVYRKISYSRNDLEEGRKSKPLPRAL